VEATQFLLVNLLTKIKLPNKNIDLAHKELTKNIIIKVGGLGMGM
jgi:hypothetical protein